GDFLGIVFDGNAPPKNNGGGGDDGGGGGDDPVLDTPQEIAEQRTIKRYKIADFTSPIPTTRLLYSFNYFNDAYGTGGDVQRHFLGVEYAFWGRRGSIEVRSTNNTFSDFAGEPDDSNWGDARASFKALLYRTEQFALTAGVGVGFPIGGQPLPVGNIYYVAPFVGWLWTPADSRWYLQGFEQLDVPSVDEDQMLLHTDVGLGYWLYRDETYTQFITGFAPTVELHVYTPLGDAPSGVLSSIVYRDVVNATFGATYFVGKMAQGAVGIGVPLMEDRDYDLEVQFHFQVQF
ncbi:MAG: hypothetical protein ACRDD1_09090, partial [Planctomycetia bacterium]